MNSAYLSNVRIIDLRVSGIVQEDINLGDLPGAAIRGAVGGVATDGNGIAPVLFKATMRRKVGRGQAYQFGITLVGPGCELFQEVITATHHAMRRNFGGGRLQLIGITEHLPDRQVQLLHNHTVAKPTGFTLAEIAPVAGDVTLEFHTPLRMIEGERLVKRFDLGVMTQRLAERVQTYAGGIDGPLTHALAATAQSVPAYPSFHWYDAWSNSRRTGKQTPVGGLLGSVTLHHCPELTALMPLLIAGQYVHVGKNASKSAGWYEVIRL